jgi:uroporphyrinogen decarboxylase
VAHYLLAMPADAGYRLRLAEAVKEDHMQTATPSNEMTPRARWLAILEGRQPDRIPTDMWATDEVCDRLLRDLACDSHEALWRKLHVDRPRFVGPTPLHTDRPAEPDTDSWGIRRRRVDYGTGEYHEVEGPPMAAIDSVNAVHRYPWPSPDDFDYSTVTAAVEADDGYRILQAGGYEPFLLYCSLRGLEQGFADLALNPDIADAMLGHLFDFFFEHNRRIYEAGQGRIKLTYVAEDLGGQTAPLMSVATYRRFLRENQRRMAELARQHGIHVMYHTDGAAYPFLRDLVDVVGIEILNPIQWRCPGMERDRLVRDYGQRIAFHGAIDNQQTLPFGSPADVIAEVKESVEIFKGARWICAPCHNLQAVSPTANIVAMYAAIREAGAL